MIPSLLELSQKILFLNSSKRSPSQPIPRWIKALNKGICRMISTLRSWASYSAMDCVKVALSRLCASSTSRRLVSAAGAGNKRWEIEFTQSPLIILIWIGDHWGGPISWTSLVLPGSAWIRGGRRPCFWLIHRARPFTWTRSGFL